ncbi:MAG: Zinc transporter ZupT [Firmicutes bacterium ADurb.Bin467]|jgi:ZIP family zinc transporter|nr:MAG: Zinc transporter ZupT [Firmicutes bacterium ADurb.Bin467]
MQLVLITALGVGGATIVGSLIGFAFKKIPHKFNDAILSFAAGVMLAAAMVGLILPALEHGGCGGAPIVALGVLAGALVINLLDRFIPHLHNLAGIDREKHGGHVEQLNKILLFVTAIAIHNLPEGLAAGVSFGTGNIGDAISVAAGIALQNVPEGMIIIAPMLAAGMSPRRTFVIAMFTGLVEVFGTLIGYLAVSITAAVLPFALAFAGGTMLYVISDEMIPETHSHGYERGATYALLIGFCAMILMDFYIG